MAQMTPRPLVQDLVKAAMADAQHRVRVSAEAARQMKLASEKCSKCDKEPCECKEEKKASDKSIPTEYALKLAGAIEFAAPLIDKMLKTATPGEGPQALPVSEAPSGPAPLPVGHSGHGHAQPPVNPPMQEGTKMQDTEAHAPGAGQKMGSAKLAQSNLARLAKLADDAAAHGEDGNITAGPAAAPTGLEAGEMGGVPNAPRAEMVGSNDAARNFTKGQAKAHEKSELGKYWKEPALTSSTDHALQSAVEHTGQAGVKVSQVNPENLMKVAAARALLTKLSSQVDSKVGK